MCFALFLLDDDPLTKVSYHKLSGTTKQTSALQINTMAEVPKLLALFNTSFKSMPDRSSSYTISKYVDRSGVNNSELKKLTDAVSPQVYSRYARNNASGVSLPFAKFLMERCTDLEDALKTPDYKKALDSSQRKQAIANWFTQLNAQSWGKPVVAEQSIATTAPIAQQEDTLTSSIVNFYVKNAGGSLKREAVSPVVMHSEPFEAPKAQNIVVQPPAKQKAEPKTPQKINSVEPKTPQKVNSVEQKVNSVEPKAPTMQDHINNIAKNKHKAVPRKDLEALATHLELAVKNGDSDMLAVYTKVVDIIHNDFDACDSAQIRSALKIAKDHSIESLPKRERRALVDLFSRGSSDVLDELKQQEGECCDFVGKNKKNLHAMADQDLLRVASRIADILEKKAPQGGKQAYVLGHNETPILRVLLNKGEDDKLARYMQFRRLASADISKDKANPFSSNAASTWDAKLSESSPFVSKDGNIAIYASAPYRDDISYFRKWAKDSGCCEEKCNIWLAPTDEVIIAQGINEKSASWTPEQLKAFVMAHQVKKNATFAAKVKKMDTGRWITNYKMTSGKQAKAMIKTKLFVDQASDNTFIPVGCVLC